MPSELAKPEQTSGAVTKIAPEVNTLARPSADYLLQARADVQADEDLQAVFRQAREEGHPNEWLVDNVTVRLSAKWGAEHHHDALEAARYLADEFEQLGEGIHLVSTETGQVLAVLDEDDIWQPDLVPRESGNMAQPLPRIRPDLEGFITTWHFETHRERQVTQALTTRAHQTDLLRDEGDTRLQIATRTGRQAIVAQLADNDPKALLSQSGGTTAAFLAHFDLVDEDPADPGHLMGLNPASAYARTRMGIQDPTTTNLNYDRASALRSLLPQGWAREIARHLILEAKTKANSVMQVPLDSIDDTLDKATIWLADPDTIAELRSKTKRPVMPVDGAALTVGLTSKVGAIVIQGFEAGGRDIFDRWEVAAPLEYRLWVDWSKVIALEVTDVPQRGEVVV